MTERIRPKVKILYPSKNCKKCPLARSLIQETITNNPYGAEPKTQLTTISLACIAEHNIATLGGLRRDEYKTSSPNGKSINANIVNETTTIAGNPPDFCPQLQSDKVE